MTVSVCGFVHVSIVAMEPRKGYWVLWSWSYRWPGAAWLESWKPKLGPMEGLHGELFIAELFLQAPWSTFGHDLILTARHPSCIFSHLSFTYLGWMVFLYDCKEGILVLASIEILQGILLLCHVGHGMFEAHAGQDPLCLWRIPFWLLNVFVPVLSGKVSSN